MAEKTKTILGILLITLLSSGIVYVAFKSDVKMRFDDDKSTFYTLNENNRFVVSGREFVSIFEGSSKKQRIVSDIKLETYFDFNKKQTFIVRTTPYYVGPIVVDTYVFDGTLEDIRQFPVSHTIDVFNAEGFIVQYEVRNLDYDGLTIKNVESPFLFGKNMKVSWDNQAYWNTVYKSGIIKVRFRPDSNHETYEVRLFDPPEQKETFDIDDVHTRIGFEIEEKQLYDVIIELKEEPDVVAYEKLKTETGYASKETKNVAKELNLYDENRKYKIREDKINLEHESIKEKIVINKEFKHLFNGVSARVTPEEYESLLNDDNVEKIWENKIFNATNAQISDIADNISATQIYNILDINNNNLTGFGVTIAILDTGLRYTHQDFGCTNATEIIEGNCDKVDYMWDFINNDNDAVDDFDHGTHVAGIAAANGVIKGIAYNATLTIYKVLHSAGSGSSSQIISGMENASLRGVDIISMSLGGDAFVGESPYAQAVVNAMNNGSLVVVAGGNNYEKFYIDSPGVEFEGLTVGASCLSAQLGDTSCNDDEFPAIATFSSKGYGLYENGSIANIKPDVLAPGVRVNSTDMDADDDYAVKSGTSMATPVVAGVAAILKQAYPNINTYELKALIANYASDIGYETIAQGTGIVNTVDSYNSSLIIRDDRAQTAIFFGHNINASLSLVNFTTTLNVTNRFDGDVNFSIHAAGQSGVTFSYNIPTFTTSVGDDFPGSSSSFNSTNTLFNDGNGVCRTPDGKRHYVWLNSESDGMYGNYTEGGSFTSQEIIQIVNNIGILCINNTHLIIYYDDGAHYIEETTDGGASWSQTQITTSGSLDSMYCVLDSNIEQHCCMIGSDDTLYYINSSIWMSEIQVNANTTDDTDDCSIDIDSNDVPWISGTGTDFDILKVWSPGAYGWGYNNSVDIYDVGSHSGGFGYELKIRNDNIYIVKHVGFDLWVFNSTISDFNNWSYQEIDADRSYRASFGVNSDDSFHIIYSNSTSTSACLFYANSTNLVNWSIRNLLLCGGNQINYPLIADSNYPASNNMDGYLRYLANNFSGSNKVYGEVFLGGESEPLSYLSVNNSVNVQINMSLDNSLLSNSTYVGDFIFVTNRSQNVTVPWAMLTILNNDECPDAMTPFYVNNNYIMNQSCVLPDWSQQGAIIINKSDIDFDCDDHFINGLVPSPATSSIGSRGFYHAFPSPHNFTIQNCSIINYHVGFLLLGADDNDDINAGKTIKFIDNEVSNGTVGVWVRDSFNLDILRNSIHDLTDESVVSGTAIYADTSVISDNSSNFNISDNIIYEVESNGIYMYRVLNSSIINNRLMNQTVKDGYGILLQNMYKDYDDGLVVRNNYVNWGAGYYCYMRNITVYDTEVNTSDVCVLISLDRSDERFQTTCHAKFINMSCNSNEYILGDVYMSGSANNATYEQFWYLTVNVTSDNANTVRFANITATNDNGTVIWIDNADSSGILSEKVTSDYFMNNTVFYNYSNMKINASFPTANYTVNSFNVNDNMDVTLFLSVGNVPVLVSPSNTSEFSSLSSTLFVWTLPEWTGNANIHSNVQFDTQKTFDSENLSNKSSDLHNNFQYYNGTDWTNYTSAGVSRDYYGYNARYNNSDISGSSSIWFWRVRVGATI